MVDARPMVYQEGRFVVGKSWNNYRWGISYLQEYRIMRPIIIIGNGIAGVTAAREIRKRDADVPLLIISGETDYHFSRTALMYIFMGHMDYEDTKPYEDGFWEKNRIGLKRGWVVRVDYDGQRVEMQGGEWLEYAELVLAVGSVPNKFGWPGQDLLGVQGLYSKQDLDQLEVSAKSARHAVIVGGGLIGVEMAEMLVSRGIGVSFLVREGVFWGSVLPKEEADMIEAHIRTHEVDLRMQEELASIHAGDDGRVEYVMTKSGERIDCQIVGLTAGVSPNVDWLRYDGQELEIERGIMVDHYFRTNMAHVWSVGDCAQFREPLPGRRPLEQVWYTGKMQATFLAQNILGGEVKYRPGVWWNSAKFFNIEYQTYGVVLPQPQEDESCFYWRAAGADVSLRIHYRTDSGAVTGVNAFGMRQRHQVWEDWICKGTTVTEVLGNLPAANFDPEFLRQYEPEIMTQWNQENPQQPIVLRQKKGLFSALMKRLNVAQ